MPEFTEADRRLLTRLRDEADILDVIARYSQGLDWMNWTQVEEAFWPEAVADFGGMFRGDRAAFLPFVTQLEMSYTRRMHLFGLPRIAINGTTAQVNAPSVTHFRSVEGGQRTESFVFGRYLLKLEKRGEEWRVLHMHFMLNSFQSNQGPDEDEGPLNLADHTTQAHPLARGVH